MTARAEMLVKWPAQNCGLRVKPPLVGRLFSLSASCVGGAGNARSWAVVITQRRSPHSPSAGARYGDHRRGVAQA